MSKKPMTITEKIFALHCGHEFVQAGDLLEAKIDTSSEYYHKL